MFGAILDCAKGGYFRIAPTEEYHVHQEYLLHTNILTTTFSTEDGEARVVDFMPVGDGQGERSEIFRRVYCVRGQITLRAEFSPRFDYARGDTTVRGVPSGVKAEHAIGSATLWSNDVYSIRENQAVTQLEMRKGDTHHFALRCDIDEPVEDVEAYFRDAFRRTKAFWDGWVHRYDYTPNVLVPRTWQDVAIRSSLVLKILFFEPPGTVAAAATTSLPEKIGGVRNWDYRYTWIRDAAFTLQALLWLGYAREAKTYLDWVINDCCRTIEGHPEDMQTMYGLRGEHDLTEYTLDHLAGYENSKPVRIGNGAFDQRQWDIYGAVFDMIWRLIQFQPSFTPSQKQWLVLAALADYVTTIWRKPDQGLWEVRDEPRHFVHSKVTCWVALDRAVKLAERFRLKGNVEKWRQNRDEIRQEVMERGWSEAQKSFRQSYDSDALDAAILRLPMLEFIDGRDPKMKATIDRIEKDLQAGEGLLYRYREDDGLPGGEGAFLLGSFWLVDALALSGQVERAEALLHRLVRLQNHVGLYSEEIEPSTGDFLGNFPQAFSHIGLVNSIFYVTQARGLVRQ